MSVRRITKARFRTSAVFVCVMEKALSYVWPPAFWAALPDLGPVGFLAVAERERALLPDCVRAAPHRADTYMLKHDA